MNNSTEGKDVAPDGGVSNTLYKRGFWRTENQKYSRIHYRLEKSAHIINRLAEGKQATLLDVGCGPATLMRLLGPNIRYYGIDIAIQEPAPYLIEADFLESPIKFGAMQFDIVVAQGVFEYVGTFQSQKFAEVAQLLNENGTFIVSYVNFNHRKRDIYWPYSNVQSSGDFRRSLSRHFAIRSIIPTSHNWNHWEPNRKLVRTINMHINIAIPIISPILAVEYFFICSAYQLICAFLRCLVRWNC
jgi:SAM-dependent methyltransferase